MANFFDSLQNKDKFHNYLLNSLQDFFNSSENQTEADFQYFISNLLKLDLPEATHIVQTEKYSPN